VENFVTRRFNMFIFSGLERLFFAVITYQPLRCALSQIKIYTHTLHNHYRFFLMELQSLQATSSLNPQNLFDISHRQARKSSSFIFSMLMQKYPSCLVDQYDDKR
jgi:hypothetical protein